MPERVDRCVESLMADPNFKPKPGKTKEQSAFALCTWLDQQGKLKATSDGVKISMEKAELLFTGPFRVVLPIIGAQRQIIEKADGEEVQLILSVRASGPERDLDGDRFSETGLAKMVEYASKNDLQFLDGHYRDLLAAILGDITQPYLTERKHFAFDVILNTDNPFAIQLFNDVLAGKRHGASIAGIVHDAEIEEYGEDGNFGRIFNDVELIEVSRTSWPSYRDSFITLLANKVGKLPQQEFDEIVQRRKEVVNLMNKACCGGDENMEKDMIVKNADESVEVWGENEAGELVQKIISPHGWDKKFSVSDVPWSSIKDRSKPCQFCIIKKNDDGSFSSSKSGYPHHLPGCNTIVRSGVFAAAVRLAQAMKSKVEGLEVPPIVSMAIEALGAEEFEAYEEKASRFSTAELKYAANHIVKHYRRDLDVEPPESLVGKAKTYEDEQQEIIDLVKSLVRIIATYEADENMEVSKVDNTDVTPAAVEETPVEEAAIVEVAPEEETPAVEQEAETATETDAETEPDETPEVETVEQSEVAGETQTENLAEKVDLQMLGDRFGHMMFAMQGMVEKAVCEKNLDAAQTAIDDFATMGKEIVSKLISVGLAVESKNFLAPFENAIEMATAKLSKSRVNRIDVAVESFIKQGLELREVLKNVDAIDDSGAVAATAKAEQAEETVSELAKKTDALMEESRRRSEELRKMAEALSQPEREEIARAQDDADETMEISEDKKLDFVKSKWFKGIGGK